MTAEIGKYAFWTYDLYPYALGGEIVEVTDVGNVKVKGYGAYIFKPLLVVDLQRGYDLQEKLDILRSEYRAAKVLLDDEFERRLKAFKKNEGVSL